MTKSCSACGKAFTNRKPYVRFCSYACSDSALRPCSRCGQSFVGRYRTHTVCPSCRERACAACGSQFSARKPGQLYCSWACACATKQSSPAARDRRRQIALANSADPMIHARRVAAIQKASQSPALRLKRSLNAAKAMQAGRHFKGRAFEYLDTRGRLWMFRSGDQWERGVARWLDAQGLTWTYESDTLLLSDGRSYVPDFWVYEWRTYLEVKGWETAKSMAKLRLAQSDGHAIALVRSIADLEQRTAKRES